MNQSFISGCKVTEERVNGWGGQRGVRLKVGGAGVEVGGGDGGRGWGWR